MSIQSTKYITRSEAEQMLREKRSEEDDISQMSNGKIETELDEIFHNYVITD